jgi:hypothetical protein
LVFIIETGKGGVALNSSLQEIMNKLKEEFASNENIFITEEFNNKYLIYISYVDMQYERNIADDEYFKTNVYTLKFNALTKELFFAQFHDTPPYIPCDCSIGYDFNEEKRYFYDNWLEIINESDWNSLHEIKQDIFHSEVQSMINRVLQILMY